MKKLVIILFLLSVGIAFSQVNASENVYISKEGTLHKHNFANPVSAVTSLTVSGTINENDLNFIALFFNSLEELNLQDAYIFDDTLKKYIKDSVISSLPLIYDTIWDWHIVKPSNNTLSINWLGHARWYTQSTSNTKLKKIIFPKSLTCIDIEAFAKCDAIEEIDLSQTKLVEIGDYAFYHCSNLKKVKFPKTLKKIGKLAFYRCDKIDTLRLSHTNVFSIDSAAFCACIGLRYIDFPNKLVNLSASVLLGCINLKKVDLSNTMLTSIGTKAFSECDNLAEVLLPNTLTSLGVQAFYKSNLQNINLSNTKLTTVKYATFKDCQYLNNLNFPWTLTSIDIEAFYNCTKFTDITFPENLVIIERNAFENCTNLQKITLNKRINVLADYSFANTKLQNVYVENPVPINIAKNYLQWTEQSNVFFNIPFCYLHVPRNSASLYQNADIWKEFYVVETDF